MKHSSAADSSALLATPGTFDHGDDMTEKFGALNRRLAAGRLLGQRKRIASHWIWN